MKTAKEGHKNKGIQTMAVVITMSYEELEVSKRIKKGVEELAESLNSVVEAVVHDRPKEVIVNKKEGPADEGPSFKK